MLTNRPKTKLLVDGGDPEETLRIRSLIGFVDGQTTNPSLIAQNPQYAEHPSDGADDKVHLGGSGDSKAPHIRSPVE